MKFKLQTLFLALILLFASPAFAQTDSLTPPSADTLLARIQANELTYNTMAMRAKMDWNDGNSEIEFQGSVRMQKDSLVWLSLTGPFSIEVARVLISPDTFKMINKLQGSYSIHNFGYLEKWLYFPVSFGMLQQVIAGQKVDIYPKATAVTIEDSMYVLYLETDYIQQKIWLRPENYTITKILLKDKMLKQSIAVNFEGYNYYKEKPFSYKRIIEINRDAVTMRLKMDIMKVATDEVLTYPFEVSDKMTKID